MFIQSKAVYIVEDNSGNANKILKDLIDNKLFDFFFDKNTDLENKSFYKFIRSLPKNTVFSIDIAFDKNDITKEKKRNISLPFISSHFSLPVKVGENIWLYKYDVRQNKENVQKTYKVDGYYLGRVHSLLNTEDLSYCFADRESTVYHIDNYDDDDIELDRPSGIKEIIDEIEVQETEESNKLHKIDFEMYTAVSDQISKTDYFKNKLRNYKLSPTNKNVTKPEDFEISGTYNASIRLTSTNSNQQDQFKDDIDTVPYKGKIEIVAGENQKIKEKSFSETKKLSFVDNDGFTNSDGLNFTTFKNNIQPEIFNGLFYESVKSDAVFTSKKSTDVSLLNAINKEQAKNIKNNSSSITVSENNKDFLSIKDNIEFTLPNITNNVFTRNNNSNLYDKSRSFITNQPEAISSKTLKLSSEDFLPSITVLSDNFIVGLHDSLEGEIIFSPNKNNYIKMSNQGNIHIDFEKIIIGNATNKPSENGLGESLFLGYSEEMQSITLGNQLKAFLEEMIEIQKETVTIVKQLFLESKNIDQQNKTALIDMTKKLSSFGLELAPLLGSIGASKPAADLGSNFTKSSKDFEGNIKTDVYETKIKNFAVSSNESKKKNEETKLLKVSNSVILQKRLESIEENLDKILSKFVKAT